jgi:hypothetical protein
VRQRLRKQQRVSEFIFDALFERIHGDLKGTRLISRHPGRAPTIATGRQSKPTGRGREAGSDRKRGIPFIETRARRAFSGPASLERAALETGMCAARPCDLHGRKAHSLEKNSPHFSGGLPEKSGALLESGVTDGARTRNNQNHNLGLYH